MGFQNCHSLLTNLVYSQATGQCHKWFSKFDEMLQFMTVFPFMKYFQWCQHNNRCSIYARHHWFVYLFIYLYLAVFNTIVTSFPHTQYWSILCVGGNHTNQRKMTNSQILLLWIYKEALHIRMYRARKVTKARRTKRKKSLPVILLPVYVYIQCTNLFFAIMKNRCFVSISCCN